MLLYMSEFSQTYSTAPRRSSDGLCTRIDSKGCATRTPQAEMLRLRMTSSQYWTVPLTRSLRGVLLASLVLCAVSCSKSESSRSPEEASLDVVEAPVTPTVADVVAVGPGPEEVGTAAQVPAPSQVPVTTAQVPVEATAPVVETGPVQTKTFSFVPSELVAGDVAGVVKHCLNCARMTKTYEYCHFDVKALHAAVGEANLSSNVTAKVSMTPLAKEMYKPKDPNAPQPNGGFIKKSFTCRVLEITK